MRDAVIVDAVRTPVGRRRGALAEIHPVDLAAHVLDALVVRTGVDPGLVEDVVWGVVNQVGDQSVNLARSAVLAAGWPERVPATTLDRQCGSSQQAIHFAAAGVVSGQYDLAVAGGTESMSRVPLGSARVGGEPFGRRTLDRFGVTEFNQGLAAELVADKWGLSRRQLDEFSLESHAKAHAATTSGALCGQLASLAGVLDTDEGVRPNSTLDTLAGLKPAFRPDGMVTAGNSSQVSDGAAALLLASADRAKALGLSPIARVHTAVVVGDDPVLMLGGVIPATVLALRRSGLGLAEIGVFEVSEAFAAVPLAWLSETGVDRALVNPNGGAIAVGHPLGASGAILMSRMVHHMRDHHIRYGLQVMCEGGGMANATVIELL